MLTSNLVVAHLRKGRVYPGFIKEEDKAELIGLTNELIGLFKANIGKRRDNLQQELKLYDTSGKANITVKGLIKLLLDRCEFASSTEYDSIEIRQTVFTLASEERYNLSLTDTLDREKILIKAGEKLGLKAEEVDKLLYADLPDEQMLKNFDTLAAESLIERYNVAIVQAILYKATKVRISITEQSPQDYRRLFRYIKFFRLIHQTDGSLDSGYIISLDGPYSLFQSVQKYGLQLAIFLPVLLQLTNWTLDAELQWGKAKKAAVLKLSSEDSLESHYHSPPELILPEIDVFKKQFLETDCDWQLSEECELVDLKGKGVCVPDFAFIHRQSGFKIYLEIFGYWSRDLVWKRLETLEQEFTAPLIMVVNKKLRVSESVAKDELPGRILVYNTIISVKQVIKLLNELFKQASLLK